MLDAVSAFSSDALGAPQATGHDDAPGDAVSFQNTGWQARLALRFDTRAITRGTPAEPAAAAIAVATAERGERDDSAAAMPVRRATYLAHCLHRGPLRIQKTLFPEGPEICHALIVHPPAGIAGGDALHIDVELTPGAHAVLSTPGATKWYKSNGRRAAQHIALRGGADTRLDWLPQNNIVFDHARADMSLTLDIDATASAIGWDATLLGRQAAGETWSDADVHARTCLKRPDGTLLWAEQAIFSHDDAIRLAAQGLDGWVSFGTLWAVVPAARADGLADAPALEAVRAMLPFDDTLRAGLTCLPNGVVLIRVTARRMEALQQLLTMCWTALRPLVHGVPGRPLRIWRT